MNPVLNVDSVLFLLGLKELLRRAEFDILSPEAKKSLQSAIMIVILFLRAEDRSKEYVSPIHVELQSSYVLTALVVAEGCHSALNSDKLSAEGKALLHRGQEELNNLAVTLNGLGVDNPTYSIY